MLRDTLRARLHRPQPEAVRTPEPTATVPPPVSGAEPRPRQRDEITLG